MTSVLIIIVSAILFAYWFCYTCILILNAGIAKDYASEVAVENRLSFLDVQERLANSAVADLQSLEIALQRDYQVVTQLLKQAGQLSIAGRSLEGVMLRVDFRIMKAYCGLSRKFSEARTRAALAEMCRIVGHLANTFGERVVSAPAVTQ